MIDVSERVYLSVYKGHMEDKRPAPQSTSLIRRKDTPGFDDLVLDKDIFLNVFERDIRRIYIYKKAERIAKAIHLIGPAFRDSRALWDRLERISFALVDASVLPPTRARDHISRELLALSSVLSIAKAGGKLSQMNADIILKEAYLLLQEISAYEDPRVLLDEAPSLAALSRTAPKDIEKKTVESGRKTTTSSIGQRDKGHKVPNEEKKKGRREEILAVLSGKPGAYIKDISVLIRGVSEKTIQRELQALVQEGRVTKSGERRWTTYTLKAAA